MSKTASRRNDKNERHQYLLRFYLRISTVFIYLPLLLLSTLFPSAGFPQQVQPTLSAELEEYVSVGENCDPWRPEVHVLYIEYHLIWSRTPLPYDDPSSPDGYWTYLVFMAPVNGPARVIGMAENSGRAHILTFIGCTADSQTVVAQYRALIQGQQWHVFSDFVFPDGRKERLASNFAQVPAPADELLAKFKLISPQKMSLTRDPINIATGEMFVFATDFSIKGRGPTLELSRTYRSQTEFSGLFGYGWRSAYDVNLTEDTNGSVVIFDKDGAGRYFAPNSDGTYAPSPGNYDTLIKKADGSFSVSDKYGIVTNYSLDGRLASIVDRNGNTFAFVFNSLAGTYIEDAGGRRITLTMDSNGRVQSAQDPAGHVVQYAYDTNGNLITITDPAGNITRYVYDTNHNIAEMTNVNGHKTYFAYDNEDRAVMNGQDGDVNKVTLSFDSDTQTTVTDALGHPTVYEFDDYGLVTSVTDSLGNITTTTWDESLNRTSVTDARGNTTGFAYDVKGNFIKVTDALGSQTQFVYTPAFNLLGSVTDTLGHTTGYTYDTRGNLSSITDALGNQTQMSYDAHGNLISTTDALNHATIFEYDGYGQLGKTIDALDHVTTLAYDAAGNNTSVTDSKGAVTAFVYDALNRLTQINFADGTRVSYSYDAFGDRLTVTDQKAQTTANAYDDYERLSQTVDALTGVTTYAYDRIGHMLSLTDANGRTTTYAYDANGRLLSETTPLGHTISYGYDAVGNLVSKTDANGTTIVYSYDALNRLTRVEYPDGSNVSYAYDVLGRQTSMTDRGGTTLYSYDALGRLVSVSGPESGNTVSYAYDALGNRTAMIRQDGRLVTYMYDALNRLSAVTDEERTTAYSYDALSNITNIAYPAGASISYSYDVMNRPVLVDNRATNDEGRATFTYEYDFAGMVTKISREDGTFTEYEYDALNRLVRETKKEKKDEGRGKKEAEEKIKYDHSYSYDAVGNRLELVKRKGDEDGKQINETYSYDAGNRLLSLTRNKEKDSPAVAVETLTYTYDANGNRVSREEIKSEDEEQEVTTTYYGYDHENRLTSLEYIGDEQDEDDILNASFAYDGNGIRTKAVEGDVITRYYYDGLNVLFEKDVVGLTQKSYTRGLGFPGGIGGLISMKRYEMEDDGLEEKTDYYHYDALGSVRGLSDEKGKLKDDFDYDAFGNGKNNKKWNTYRFSSKEFEDHAGLYYFGARYYDPEIGRWLTPDPLGFIDGPNGYAYVRNNPVNFVDPWGYEILGTPLLPIVPVAPIAPLPILTPPTPQITLSAQDIGILTIQSNSQAGKENANLSIIKSLSDDTNSNLKGGKKGQRDRDFGIKDKGFWKWWEKIKPKVKGQDLTASDVWIWYEQYKNEKGK